MKPTAWFSLWIDPGIPCTSLKFRPIQGLLIVVGQNTIHQYYSYQLFSVKSSRICVFIFGANLGICFLIIDATDMGTGPFFPLPFLFPSSRK